jgi:hypothetical protein
LLLPADHTDTRRRDYEEEGAGRESEAELQNPNDLDTKESALQPQEGYHLPKVVWPASYGHGILCLRMRVNIKARIPMHLYQEFHTLPLVLTIETAHGLAARCEHRTTAAQLMWTLDQKTDINAGLLDRFRQKLRLIEEANLTDVEVSDEVLDMFGFFL